MILGIGVLLRRTEAGSRRNPATGTTSKQLRRETAASGRAIPSWRVFWGLFGASNQLLAALTLVGVTVWLYRTYRARWVWAVAGLPALFMYAMSAWALVGFLRTGFFGATGAFDPLGADAVAWAALVLVLLAAVVLLEALRAIRIHRSAGLAGEMAGRGV